MWRARKRLHSATARADGATRCVPTVSDVTETDLDEVGSGGERDRPVGGRTRFEPVEYDAGVQLWV